ncbi:MAG: hypothetical protein AAGH15_16785 [Myxococcota bacterium]
MAEPPEEPRSFLPILVRDVALIIACVGAWQSELRDVAAGVDVPLARSLLAGGLTVVVGFFAHEYGHLLGALASGARVHAQAPWSPLLFHFDVARSTRRQFLAMSYGGYAASAVSATVIALTVPWDRLSGWTALGLMGVGLFVTAVLEIPTHVRVLRGGPLPTGAAYVSE